MFVVFKGFFTVDKHHDHPSNYHDSTRWPDSRIVIFYVCFNLLFGDVAFIIIDLFCLSNVLPSRLSFVFPSLCDFLPKDWIKVMSKSCWPSDFCSMFGHDWLPILRSIVSISPFSSVFWGCAFHFFATKYFVRSEGSGHLCHWLAEFQQRCFPTILVNCCS